MALPPGESAFVTATLIKPSSWKGKFWVRWTDAVREAGYEPNSLTQRIPDDVILEQLSQFILELGRFPVRDEINLHARRTPDFPVWQTVKKRFGGMPEAATALLKFARAKQIEPLAALWNQESRS